ncbi:hypothetical protein V6N13_061826 [Hibiscus sabdariffa]
MFVRFFAPQPISEWLSALETFEFGPLANLVDVCNHRQLPKLSVAAMVDELGNWKWPLLQHLLTLPILLRIMAIKVPSPLFPDDEALFVAAGTVRFLACFSLVYPPIGWVKLNCDGTYRAGDGTTSCGGVFRDSKGAWLYGFFKFIGCCSIVEAELWGIFVGLSLA